MDIKRQSVWSNFRFSRFFASFAIGNLGDWFDIFALQLIFVHEFNASPVTMGFLALFYFLPGALLGPYAGVCADRFSKRNLMLWINLLSAFFTLGLLFSSGIFSALTFLFLRSTVATLNPPTQQGYIKEVVSDAQLLQASSYTSVAFQLSKMFGPILGAVILIYLPARTCIALNVVSFVVAMLVVWTLPRDKATLHGDILTKLKRETNWLRDLQDGAKYVVQHGIIRMVLGLAIAWFFCSMLRNSQLAIFLKYLLPNEPNALGYVLGLDALGAALVGLILSRRKYITNYAGYFMSGFFLIGLGVLGIATYHNSWPKILFYIAPLILGFGSGINMIVYGYVLKKETLEHQIGCIYGISSALQNAALALGTIASGFLVISLGERQAFVSIAIIMFLLSIFSVFIPKKKKQE